MVIILGLHYKDNKLLFIIKEKNLKKVDNPLFAFYFGWFITLMLIGTVRRMVTNTMYYLLNFNLESVILTDSFFQFLTILHITGMVCYIIFKPKNRT